MPSSPSRFALLLCRVFTILSLSACGTTSPAVRAWEGVGPLDSEECEEPHEDACVVVACDGELGECGLFGCEAVAPEAIAGAQLERGVRLASGGG